MRVLPHWSRVAMLRVSTSMGSFLNNTSICEWTSLWEVGPTRHGNEPTKESQIRRVGLNCGTLVSYGHVG
jgi:hypothetical protein